MNSHYAFLNALKKSKRNAISVHGVNYGGDVKPLIMGIANITPDSFFDGSRYNDTLQKSLNHISNMLDAGANIIDIGGESTRPGSSPVSVEQELERIIPVVDALDKYKNRKDFLISIDTMKASVAQSAIIHGADIINDVSLLSDKEMPQVIAESSVAIIVGHIRGNPQTMQDNIERSCSLENVFNELNDASDKLISLGISSNRIAWDPGVGFGKSLEENYRLIAALEYFHKSEMSLVMGMSRKSYIGKTIGLKDSDRLIPSVTSAIVCDLAGASIIRVHDVKETHEAIIMLDAFRSSVSNLEI